MKTLNIKNIVVPVDFSAMSIQAIQCAKKFGSRFRAKVHLLHIHEFSYPAGLTGASVGLPAAVPDWSTTIGHEMGERLLNELKAVGRRFSIPLKNCHLRHGAPVFDVICEFAREVHAELVITPTHGYTGLRHVFLGSTAERLVQHSGCPVLVTKDQKPGARSNGEASLPMKRILVPVDFSTCSLAGLQYAIQLAEEFEASITVLHVVDFGSTFTADGYAMYDFPRLETIAREEAEQEMHRFLSRLNFGRVKFESKVITELFVDALNSAIRHENIDLVVIATHGRTGLRHVLIGSTAELIVRRAACPVLVVPSHPVERRQTLTAGERRIQALSRSNSTAFSPARQPLGIPSMTKRFRKINPHPFPERRKTNKFRETHQPVSK